jgi:hypothetical protein
VGKRVKQAAAAAAEQRRIVVAVVAAPCESITACDTCI